MPVDVLIRYRASAPMPDNNYEETLHQFERRIRLGTAGQVLFRRMDVASVAPSAPRFWNLRISRALSINSQQATPGRRSLGEGDINLSVCFPNASSFGESFDSLNYPSLNHRVLSAEGPTLFICFPLPPSR